VIEDDLAKENNVLPGQDAPHVGPREWLFFRMFLMFASFCVAYLGLFIAGDETRRFAVAGLEVVPLVILAVLAYLGQERRWGKVITLLYWFAFAAAILLIAVVFVIIGLIPPETLKGISSLNAGPEGTSTPEEIFGQGEILRIVIALVGLVVAAVTSAACFLPVVRRAVAKILPIEPDSFVHATALATVLIVTLSSFIPLIVSGKPPLLQLVSERTALENAEQLRTAFYALIWAMPAALIAVGYPRWRNLRDVVERLAIAWPNRRQVIFALFLTIGLLGGMLTLGRGLTWLWLKLGWPTTDAHATWTLFGYALTPFAAVIVSVCAGVGEEVVFRGVLQPRIGVVIAALMFTSIHAFQYGLDALIQVLIIGLVLGYIRKFSNTTTSAIVHSGYDLCILLLASFSGG
jgi:membrane protease YdiL (CAAX protease family)